MTEQDWFEYSEPDVLLAYLYARTSHRKLRLFGCACCRRIWHLFADERCRAAIEGVERFADATTNSERNAIRPLRREAMDAESFCKRSLPSRAARFVAARSIVVASNQVSRIAAQAHGENDRVRIDAELVVQSTLLRDIFGNPFRPVTLDPRWQSSTVLDLARTIYEQRTFATMPILGDALMDAGCDSEEVIQHCQGPGPHVRGCWVVDLLTGKE